MNNKIQALMAKTLDEHFKETWTSMSYQDLVKFSEKFAELLVKECAKFMDDNTFYYDYGDWSIPEPKDMLKHFGVE